MAKLKAKHLFDLTFVSDARLSPDGRRVATVQTTVYRPEGADEPPGYRSHLFLYDTAAPGGLQLTRSGEANTQPRFSPDGAQLAFCSKRGSAEAQLYLLPLGGGEARALTELKAGVGEVVWHPSGRALALTSRGDAEAAERVVARTIDRLFYKGDGLGFRPGEPEQIYLHNLDTARTERLTRLPCSPSSLAFSPDGDRLYFTAAPDTDAEDRWEGLLWALPTGGKGKPERLAPNLRRVFAVSPSPDRTRLAVLAATDQDNFAAPTGLWLAPAAGGDAVLLTGGLEAAPSVGGDSQYGAYPNTPAWADDGESVFINLNAEGRSGVARVTLGGRVRPLQRGERAVSGFHHQGGRFAFTAETPSRPGEVFCRDARGKETRLSDVNGAFADYRLAEASPPRRAKARGGPKLTYWTLEPRKPRKDRALVVQVHGGPHTNYGYGFYLEFQLLAAQGYTVVYGNPRGSSSYGADFATDAQGRYGTVDADDVMAITAAARRAHPDPDAPVHLTGGSYGGFMTNWLVTQTPLFRSAVTQRSISNWGSFYGTSDIGYGFTEQELGGNPWEDLPRLWHQSPIKHVAAVSTPLLILHSDEDLRCPVEQAEQLFVALKRLGKETRLVRFPGEGHELSRSGRPDRRVARLEAIVGWFEAHP